MLSNSIETAIIPAADEELFPGSVGSPSGE
jgi:hypothetical protein